MVKVVDDAFVGKPLELLSIKILTSTLNEGGFIFYFIGLLYISVNFTPLVKMQYHLAHVVIILSLLIYSHPSVDKGLEIAPNKL